MTEVKWGIIFAAVFLTLIFGLEYKIQLVEKLTLTKIQYNEQLDTCLTDTLRNAEVGFRSGEGFFYNPDRVRRELEEQLEFAFSVHGSLYGYGKGEKGQKAHETEGIYSGIMLLILFEPDGFYYYGPEMEAVSEKIYFPAEKPEEKLSMLEAFMEATVKEQFSQKEKRGRLCFTFPKEERSIYAQTVKGTGLLLVYEAGEVYFQDAPYERFLLSGARLERQ